jgi:hypothetical protein
LPRGERVPDVELELFGEELRQPFAAALLVARAGRIAPARVLRVHEDFRHFGDEQLAQVRGGLVARLQPDLRRGVRPAGTDYGDIDGDW